MSGSRSWLTRLWSSANTLGFGIRNLVRWRVPILVDRVAPPEPLFPHLADPARALRQVRDWEERYGIDPRRLAPEIETVRDALYMLGMLEGALDDAGVRLPAETIDALDIGAKNWHYVRAVWELLERHGLDGPGGDRRQVRLTGIEIDPFVVYRDGHSRHDWARLYAKPLPGATYLAGDALEHRGSYDLVLLLFPILRESEHLDWGLPLDRYRPADLIRHAYDLTRPGGALILSCYDYERPDLLAILERLGMQPRVARPHESELANYEIGRFVTVFIR